MTTVYVLQESGHVPPFERGVDYRSTSFARTRGLLTNHHRMTKQASIRVKCRSYVFYVLWISGSLACNRCYVNTLAQRLRIRSAGQGRSFAIRDICTGLDWSCIK